MTHPRAELAAALLVDPRLHVGRLVPQVLADANGDGADAAVTPLVKGSGWDSEPCGDFIRCQ
jgi:hypothetical protein